MTHPAPRKPLRGRLFLVLLPSLLPLVLANCAVPGAPPPGSPEAQARESLVDACRQRADEAYNLTHRGDIYAPASQMNTPFSANYQPGVPDRGLSNLYERDRMVSDCVRNTGADFDRTPPGAPLPPARGVAAPNAQGALAMPAQGSLAQPPPGAPLPPPAAPR